jgi:hypothetical protein
LSSVTWPAATPWLVRAALLAGIWFGMSSDSEAVSSVSRLLLFGLLPSFGQLLGRRQRAVPVLSQGDTWIVLHQAAWRDWDKIKRVLHDELNVDYSTARGMFRDLPVTLEPALVPLHAERVVARLRKAGASASAVTIDPAPAPEQLSGGPVRQP